MVDLVTRILVELAALARIEAGGFPNIPQALFKLLASKACRGSIMFGQEWSSIENYHPWCYLKDLEFAATFLDTIISIERVWEPEPVHVRVPAPWPGRVLLALAVRAWPAICAPVVQSERLFQSPGESDNRYNPILGLKLCVCCDKIVSKGRLWSATTAVVQIKVNQRKLNTGLLSLSSPCVATNLSS